MSEIYVQSSSSVQTVINELTRLNSEFRSKATEIDGEHSSLVSKWQGEASEEFQRNFRKEQPNFDSFASAIDEYVNGLRDILAHYETAENQNIAIASE